MNYNNSVYSPIAEASIKDLEIKKQQQYQQQEKKCDIYKTMAHTDESYNENKVLRLPLKEVIESIKTISLGKEFQSLIELTKKRIKKRYSFGEGLF